MSISPVNFGSLPKQIYFKGSDAQKNNPIESEKKESSLSNESKVLIGLGSAALLCIGIYIATKGKNTKGLNESKAQIEKSVEKAVETGAKETKAATQTTVQTVQKTLSADDIAAAKKSAEAKFLEIEAKSKEPFKNLVDLEINLSQNAFKPEVAEEWHQVQKMLLQKYSSQLEKSNILASVKNDVAKKCLKDGQIDEAQKLFTDITKIGASDEKAYAYENLMKIAQKSGNAQEASVNLNQAIYHNLDEVKIAGEKVLKAEKKGTQMWAMGDLMDVNGEFVAFSKRVEEAGLKSEKLDEAVNIINGGGDFNETMKKITDLMASIKV